MTPLMKNIFPKCKSLCTNPVFTNALYKFNITCFSIFLYIYYHKCGRISGWELLRHWQGSWKATELGFTDEWVKTTIIKVQAGTLERHRHAIKTNVNPACFKNWPRPGALWTLTSSRHAFKNSRHPGAL